MNRHSPDDVLYLGRVDFRSAGTLFGIRRADRAYHVYTIGRTGTGKSTLLKTMVAQDMAHGEGLALLDPHGDLADAVLDLVPERRRGDLVFLCPGRLGGGFTFNPFSDVPPARRSLAAAGIVEVFRKLWPDDWGPRLEHLLRNVVFTLLEVPGASLGDVPRLLADRVWRRSVVQRLSNEEVRSFWLTEYERYSPAFRAVVTAPLQNKVGAFLTDPLLRRILSAPKSSFSVREIMDEGRIVVANLAKGRIGEGPAALLGSLLVSHIMLAGLARAEVMEDERRDFWVYLDEFQTFGTLTLATMLSELRKYHVGLALAHQYLGQLQPEVRDAVLGNVGTLIAFRVGAQDAPLLARELAPKFVAEDLVNLPNYRVYLRVIIDAAPSQPFSAATLPPAGVPEGHPITGHPIGGKCTPRAHNGLLALEARRGSLAEHQGEPDPSSNWPAAGKRARLPPGLLLDSQLSPCYIYLGGHKDDDQPKDEGKGLVDTTAPPPGSRASSTATCADPERRCNCGQAGQQVELPTLFLPAGSFSARNEPRLRFSNAYGELA